MLKHLMPPFGDEPCEKTPKPLGFVSFRDAADSKRKPPRPKLFAAEPAEATLGVAGAETRASRPRPVSKRPFEDEGDEGACQSYPSKVKHEKQSPSSLYGDEPTEVDQVPPLTNHWATPFGDEGDEDSYPSSGDELADDSFDVKQESVFSFGWNSVSTFKKATFWREKKDDEGAVKPKRAYDNSKRASEAVYARQKSKGFYQRNGLDPTRLQNLFDATQCLCASDCTYLVFNFSTLIVSPPQMIY
jgi:hypothetical protein